MPTISDNLNIVKQRIASAAQRSSRPAEAVSLVAVAKTASANDLREAYSAGHRLFGHNRVQALEEHRLVLPDAEWHLLGPLQGKKVLRGVAACNVYQALANIKTAQRIERVLAENGRKLDVLLQVNVHSEDGRNGLSLEQVDAFCDEIAGLEHIQLAGVMNLAVADANDTQLHNDFAAVRECFESLQKQRFIKDDAILSMGMSGDFEIAISEGANLVRVGRAIFPVSG
jgi:pyridoxal phosphate enzyme (YggS family)|tara:strand:+ start:241 stop:924 length:684 start_codon:yes stop_codon:yes gene_type:complete